MVDQFLKKILFQRGQNNPIYHGLFWSLVYYTLLHYFVGNQEVTQVDYIYTIIFIGSLMLGVYANLLFLMPLLLNRGKLAAYAFSLIGLLLASTFFNELIFTHIIDIILPQYYFISYYSFGDILKFFLVFIGLTSLLHWSKAWFKLQEIQQETTQMELQALRAQLNPHFLFNALNVLYLLALKQSKDSPSTIVKLSDILRYVIYDSNKDQVSIQSEIKLLEDYLSIQQYRVEEEADIQFDKLMEADWELAPMLFLPLLENSFKHGLKGDTGETYIHIKLQALQEKLIFEIENNKGQSNNGLPQKTGGIGLANIRKRLNLIYPNRHFFEIKEQTHSFKVSLIIGKNNVLPNN